MLAPEVLAIRLKTDLKRGLSAMAAQELYEKDGPNRLSCKSPSFNNDL